MYDISQLVGVIALITVIVNLLKFIPGLIKDGQKTANAIQTIVALVLTVVGTFFPDALNSLPLLDGAAEMLSKLGALVLAAIPIITQLGNWIHDGITQIPLLNKLFGKQITP